MKHRMHFTKKERLIRSNLVKIVHNYGLLVASLVRHSRKCGKPGCKCNYGEKHSSLYLSFKGKMIYIPPEMEEKVVKWVQNYKRLKKLLEEISQECLKRLIKEKQTVKKIS